MNTIPSRNICRIVCTKRRLALAMTLALVALFATVGVLARNYSSLPASNGAGEPKSFMMSLSSFPSMVMTRFFPQKSSQAKNSISTDKRQYVAGEAVTITGAGFLPGEALTVQVKHADGSAEPGMGHEVFAATAGADGTFDATWSLHSNDSAGKDFIAVAFGNSSGFSSIAQFSRIARVQTEKSGYRRGNTAVVTGSGFFPNEPVTLEVTQPDGSVQQQVVNADAAGSIASNVVVSADSSTTTGAMTLAATGVVSGLTATSSALPVVTCPSNLNSCTAKDVRTTVVNVGILNGDFCSSLTDTINLQVTVEFKSTSNERYDVGMFVSNDGGTVQEPSSANTCSGAAPQVGDGNANAYPADADTDLFLNLESPAVDTCGDISATTGPVQWTFTSSVDCNIVNNQLIIPSCRVWDQTKNHNCTSLTQAGTGSKCDCTDLVVTPQLNPCATTVCNDNSDCTDDSCVNNGSVANCVYTPKAAGASCGNSSSNACDNADTCNASGVCQSNHVADGGSCGDAGTACTNQDTCLAGVCHDNGFKASGTACGTGSSDACDAADTCNGAGTCQVNHVADGTNCGDAGGACTNQDTCLAGACHDNGFKSAGTACGSSSSGQCDAADTCNGSGTCQLNHVADGTSCGDAGTKCTNQDTCSGGGCQDNGFKAAGTTCVGTINDHPCDATDSCNGSGNCVDAFDTPPQVTLALNLACENQGGATSTQLVASVSPSGSYSYSWTGPDGPIATNAAAITPTKPGTYTVVVTDTATSCPNDAAFKLCFGGEQLVASAAPTQQLQATASFTVPARSQPTGFRAYLAKLLSVFG